MPGWRPAELGSARKPEMVSSPLLNCTVSVLGSPDTREATINARIKPHETMASTFRLFMAIPFQPGARKFAPGSSSWIPFDEHRASVRENFRDALHHFVCIVANADDSV